MGRRYAAASALSQTEGDPLTLALHEWLRKVVPMPAEAEIVSVDVVWRDQQREGQEGPFVSVTWTE